MPLKQDVPSTHNATFYCMHFHESQNPDDADAAVSGKAGDGYTNAIWRSLLTAENEQSRTKQTTLTQDFKFDSSASHSEDDAATKMFGDCCAVQVCQTN